MDGDEIESGGEMPMAASPRRQPQQSAPQAQARMQPAGSQGQLQQMPDPLIHPSGIVPVLQNIVATVNLGCRLDLKEIALHARNAEYNPKVQ